MKVTMEDIARLAGVNECTLFRKFQNKKDIVLHGMEQEKWRGNVTPDIFQKVEWDLEADLPMFMREYMRRITPDFVNPVSYTHLDVYKRQTLDGVRG